VTVQESMGEKTTAKDENRKKSKVFTKIALTITNIVGICCHQGCNSRHATLQPSQLW
jgi:Rieske Fe-S protein